MARVVEAEELPKAKKLLKLTLSLGGDNHRTVFAGIKSAYKAEDLVGRLVICVANLRRAKCNSASAKGWSWPPAREARKSIYSAPTTARSPAIGSIKL